MRGLGGIVAPAALLTAAILPAAAQQPPLPAEYELKLSAEEMVAVEKGLLELPGKTMIQAYAHIIEQVKAQQDAAKKPPEAAVSDAGQK